MRPRGFTLMEILIAIGLVIAIAALALPPLLGAARRQALDTAVDVLESQLRLARAHAQSTGAPVEVVYEPDTACVVARRFSPEAGASATGDGAPGGDPRLAPPRRGARSDDDQDEDAALLRAPWARRAVPDGVTIERTPPEDAARDLDDPAAREALVADLERDLATPPPDETAPRRLAVFLPDGSALLAEAAWVCADDGRAMRVEVNPWTGQPRAARLEDVGAPPEDGDETDETEIDEDEADDARAADGGDDLAPPDTRDAAGDTGPAPGGAGAGDDESGGDA